MSVDEKEVISHIVDGNGVPTEVYRGDRVTLTRASSIVAKKKMDEKKAAECEPLDFEYYVKTNVDELKLLLPHLSTGERAMLTSIQPYINYDSNLISHGQNCDISTEDLIVLAGISRKTGYKVINSLVKRHVLYRGSNGRNTQYFINPWLYAKGNMKNKTLREMFGNYRVLTRGGVPWYMLKD